MSTIELSNVSRWYGNVVAVNDITMTIGPGVTGLLGPNGAGKSTMLHMIAGFLAPSRGELTVGGTPSWHNPGIYRTLGLVPERDSVYAFLTGAEFVRATARLHKLPDPGAAARRAIEMVEMTGAQDRKISTYSKGMRQRIRVAGSLVHDPEVLLLDEPFNGMDPRQRLHMMDLLHGLGEQGRTILFSSHILEEVERLSGTIQVMVVRAARRVRRLPRHQAPDDEPAARVPGPHLGRPAARRDADRPSRGHRGGGDRPRAAGAGVRLRRLQPGDSRRSPGSQGIRLRELLPEDESLESVFAYLIDHGRGLTAAPGRQAWTRRPGKRQSHMSGDQARVVASITLRATDGPQARPAVRDPAGDPAAGHRAAASSRTRTSRPGRADILGDFGFSVVLPLTALIIGTSVLGAEIDDGSVVHLLATPVRRSTVI